MHRLLGSFVFVAACACCANLCADDKQVDEDGISFTIPNVVEFLRVVSDYEFDGAQIKDGLVWATCESGLQFQVTILSGSGGAEALEQAEQKLSRINAERPGPGSGPDTSMVSELGKDEPLDVLEGFTDEVENSPGAIQIAHLTDKEVQGILVRSFTLLSRDSEGQLFTYISARVVGNKFVTTSVTHEAIPRTPEQTADLRAFLASFSHKR